jgi:hypothetical protein
VIYDSEGSVVRRLEQKQGAVISPGYVDFFNSHRCRSTVAEHHIVDTAPDGTETILATHTHGSDANGWLKAHFGSWAMEHGVSA